MKSYKYISIAALVVLAAGCSDLKESPESSIFTDEEIILTATREGLDPGTRSVRQDDGSVYWGPSEAISVFYGSEGWGGGSKFVSTNTSNAKKVEFQGTIETTEPGKEYWAVYPYSVDNELEDNDMYGSLIFINIPFVQTGVEGNFSDNAFPAIAKGSSTSLAFWNVCGGVKFSVSRSDIKSVTFKGNSADCLAGRTGFFFNSEGKPEIDFWSWEEDGVTLIAPDNGTFKAGKYYYITMLPESLSGGFTMTFTTESQTGSFRSDEVQEIKRSTFGVLKNIDSKVTNWESNVPVPEYVDLGLSVKWASFNVGAAKPEDYGFYFAWGETTTKDSYLESNYLWCDGSNLTKYTGDATVLEPDDDAASALLGGSWRMPTEAEMEELLNGCTWTWTTKNGVDGYTVSGKGAYSGNSIFIPAAGYFSGTYNSDEDWAGSYWTSTLYHPNNFKAIKLDFTKNVSSLRAKETNREFGLPIRPVFGGGSYVDLGLPSGLKWATCNVGAFKPEEYGEYFAWGETESKYNFKWSTYKWCNGGPEKLTKYCTNSSYWGRSAPMDNKKVLDSDDDAASANWGDSWRMPTDEDWTELRENCTWTWTNDYNGTGIAGRIVTSNMSGYKDKSIFLPAAGYRENTDLYNVGYTGLYWSSSLHLDYPFKAWAAGFIFSAVGRESYNRYDYGFSVRPVTE
ncbi:MAG: fibrobacter succinogenes major paralogous domain-containing protein [Bacteroidales bacterium]|nr:fibrobacter succinogenes major paralogous domain-containing protein [Bacteroidales bacterium]